MSDDGRYNKSFRKGGPLEWHNPPEWSHGGGIKEHAFVKEPESDGQDQNQA